MSAARELLKFWNTCALRRREQLKLHKQSADAIMGATPNTPTSVEELRSTESNEVLRLQQLLWIRDAENKLRHADNMCDFFRRLVRAEETVVDATQEKGYY